MQEMSRQSEAVPGQGSPPDAELQILGGTSLRVAGNIVTDDSNRSLKLWGVLCYLILNRGRIVTQAELIEAFWPEEHGSNPLSALKMLILRLRHMLEPLFGADLEPILSRRRAYQWNPDIPCQVDAERFEALCLEAERPDVPAQRRAELYQEAIALYKGELLPKQSGQQWVISLSSRYHDLYVNAVKAYAAQLEEAGQYKQMGELCIRAGNLAPLDEQLHLLILRALLLQNNTASALRHYEKVTKLLYDTLGVRPSEDMRTLYLKIMSAEKEPEQDLDMILRSMGETDAARGAFVCEFGFFEKLYQLESRRRIPPNRGRLHIALLTLSAPENGRSILKRANRVMEALQDTLVENLRQGDVVSRYSRNQYIVMLHYADPEDSVKVVERIVSAFHHRIRKGAFTLTYKLRSLEGGAKIIQGEGV